MVIHLRRSGSWAVCEREPGTCKRLVHLQETDVAAAQLMPPTMVESILQVVDPPTVDNELGRQWRRGTHLHRQHGLPARIYADGTRCWYRRGYLHRKDGPAIVSSEAAMQDPRVRVLSVTPTRQRIFVGTYAAWYHRGQLHREGGPAEIYENGGESWYQFGELHREDGPALLEPDRKPHYYLRGKRLKRREFERLRELA